MLEFKFTPFPILSTQRLLLRKLTNDDVEELFIMRSDKTRMKYVPRPVAKEKQEALDLIERINTGIDANQNINWVIELKETKQFVGTIGYYRRTLSFRSWIHDTKTIRRKRIYYRSITRSFKIRFQSNEFTFH